jgi:hypothetical protein
MVGFCEHVNEHLYSIKEEFFFEKLNKYKLFNKCSVKDPR